MVKIVIEVSDGVTNGDIIQNICSMWIEYHDTDIEVTVDKKVWNAPYKKVDMAKAIRKGTPLPKGHDVDTLLQKATDEIFVQCKQFNENFSKDWNEGFNDGMFHTLTIIKEIIKADKEVDHEDSN